MTDFVLRAELGWPASAAPDQESALGSKIHYEGTSVSNETHDDCIENVKAIRKAHLNHPTENYSDIAYNLIVCKHGTVFECRGKDKRSGANGNQELNKAHYAICALLGVKGDIEPTPEMIAGIKWAVAYMRKNGAGKEIKGHRDGRATACPGEALYALVKAGKLEPDKPKPKPVYAPYPGEKFFRIGKKHELFTAMAKRLKAEGYNGYKEETPNGVFDRGDIRAVSWWQKRLGYSGKDADGYPGKASWDKLKVPQS